MDITHPSDNIGKVLLFSRLTVAETMRKRVISLTAQQSIGTAIRTFVKYKIDCVLICNNENMPAGVVSRTEIMGAYYAGMPIDTPLSDIMAAPVIQCLQKETLESALITMQQARIHHLYVTEDAGRAVGTLSYPDIVGTLYKHCCNCDHGLQKKSQSADETRLRFTVKEAMTASVTAANLEETIEEVIEKLSSFHLGALLVVDDSLKPAGVISKADLALAYSRSVSLSCKARTIMNSPAQLCHEDTPLEAGIRLMVLKEISRLFIYAESEETVRGVLSLSDAARMRSGSCQACSTTRIRVKD